MKNFEEFTHNLTDGEKWTAELLVLFFADRTGKKNTFRNQDLQAYLERVHGVVHSAPRIRKIIQYIRMKGMIKGLIATGRGYWVTTDPEELKSWIESMKERENAVRASRKAGERDLSDLLKSLEQTKLFE